MFEKESESFMKNVFSYEDEEPMYGEEQVKRLLSIFAESIYNKVNGWYKVSDKLPEMNVLVYLWNKIDNFPVVACRHIPYGHKEWVWDCKWGSGFTVSQLAGKDYLWKEIVLPKLKEGE